jgi:hypothetical protein
VVAKDMQGRVVTLQYALGGSMTPLALLIAGPAADVIGLRMVWWVAGAIMVLFTGVMFYSREVMNIENEKTVGESVAESVDTQL